MNRIKVKSLGLLLLATLISCGDGGSSSSPSSYLPQEGSTFNPSTAVDAPEIDIKIRKKVDFVPDFSNFETFKENINSYVVIFRKKNKALANVDINCKKNIYTQKPQMVTGTISAYADEAELELTIKQDDPHKLDFVCEVSLDGNVITTYKDKLLKSFIVTDEKSWSYLLGSEAEIDTLILEEDSSLITQDINVNLKVKKLIANHGRITTFSAGSEDTTLDNHAGLSGGKIKIHASEAYGALAFDLRGLNGGKQTKIPSVREPLPRDVNLDGKCKGSIRERDYNNPKCFGKHGHKGLVGHPGFAGLKGGDSGSLDLTIDTNALEFAVHYYPGIGSNGGEGGEGGLGSPGGRGSKVDIIPSKDGPICPMCRIESYYNSKKFPDGKPGAKGEKGKQGVKGQNGVEQDSVIVINNVKEIINSFWKNN